MNKSKHSDYITKAGKTAIEDNKKIKSDHKKQIRDILKKEGYDPTIKYTRKEKKRFTKAVRNTLFKKPVAKVQTKEEILSIIKAKQEKRKALFEARPHVKLFKDGTKRAVQKTPTAEEMDVKETPEDRVFKYTINRIDPKNSMRNYDFLTDYFNADSANKAKTKAKSIAKKFVKENKENDFAGIRIQDSKSNLITFYPKETLLAAQYYMGFSWVRLPAQYQKIFIT